MLKNLFKKPQPPKVKGYKFVPSNEDSFALAIEILEGKFSGLIFRAGKIGFSGEENPDSTMNMTFDYNIESNEKGLAIGQDCVNIMGDILCDVMEKEMKEKGKLELRSAEDFRDEKKPSQKINNE